MQSLGHAEGHSGADDASSRPCTLLTLAVAQALPLACGHFVGKQCLETPCPVTQVGALTQSAHYHLKGSCSSRPMPQAAR